MARPALDRLFAPRSVAVIGASRHPGKVGHTVLKNLTKHGFPGQIYPVNPNAKTLADLPCYADISAVPSVPDLAVIVVPAPAVLPTVTACGQQGVPFVIVMSAGFKETGREGQKREQELAQVIKTYDMRLIGPNCLGLLSTHHKLNATFASPADYPMPGSLAMISQSGALGTAILDVSVTNPLFGLSHFVSLGNKLDIDEAELLEYLVDDPKTKVIAMYVEGLAVGRTFLEAAHRVTRSKPVLVLKSGRSSSGQQAISSHTGSLAGSDVVYDAALRSVGVIRAQTFQELIDVSTALVHLAPMKHNRVAIITNAGGPAILATDALAEHGLELSQLHNVTTRRLEKFLPENASTHNPIDILGDALSDRYRGALEIVHRDTQVDALLVILTPQAMTDISLVADVVAEYAKKSTRPILACFMGDHRVEKGRESLAEAHVPVFEDPNQAVIALAGLYRYTALKPTGTPGWQTIELMSGSNQVEHIITQTQALNQPRLSLIDTMAVFDAIGIGITPTEPVTTQTAAKDWANRWSWPVVMKIDAPALNHKSDSGAVKVGIDNHEELVHSYQALQGLIAEHQWPEAKIVIQPQAPKTVELLIGARRDPTFGPVVTVALGGIYVEIFKDAATSLAPVTLDEAVTMLKSLQASPLLEGARGQERLSLRKIAEVVVKISQLIALQPSINQLDINPLFAYRDEVIALDGRIILTQA